MSAEVNINNFDEKFPDIETAFKRAKFIGVDCEFSALHPVQQPSLFDSPAERYTKLRRNLQQVIPIQIGLTAFHFDPDENCYNGQVFTFHILPVSFGGLDRAFYFQSSTMNFLKMYKFDFNQFVYNGIPYVNRKQEEELRVKLFNRQISPLDCGCRQELDQLLLNEGLQVKQWYSSEEHSLVLPSISEKYKNQYELIYFFSDSIRRLYPNIWIGYEDNRFVLKKPTTEVYTDPWDLERNLLHKLTGFTRVFRLITNLRKPIVGHNLFQDLILLIHNFEEPVPASYSSFKKLSVKLFPQIFDTKTISYDLNKIVDDDQRWTDTSLSGLFEFFKNGKGRHIAKNSPAIEFLGSMENYGQLHNAGWDSFSTGYIFIRLAHLVIYKQYPESKTFMSTELIAGLIKYQNCVNVIRGVTSFIRLDGDDPETTRPPWLVVKSVHNKRLDLSQVVSIMSTYGFVEIKTMPFTKRHAIVAVDNYGSARRILQNFQKHQSDYQINKYNPLKHSPVLRLFILGGITVSGAIFTVLSLRYFK